MFVGLTSKKGQIPTRIFSHHHVLLSIKLLVLLNYLLIIDTKISKKTHFVLIKMSHFINIMIFTRESFSYIS